MGTKGTLFLFVAVIIFFELFIFFWFLVGWAAHCLAKCSIKTTNNAGHDWDEHVPLEKSLLMPKRYVFI